MFIEDIVEDGGQTTSKEIPPFGIYSLQINKIILHCEKQAYSYCLKQVKIIKTESKKVSKSKRIQLSEALVKLAIKLDPDGCFPP